MTRTTSFLVHFKILPWILALTLLVAAYPLLRPDLENGPLTAQFLLSDDGAAISIEESSQFPVFPLPNMNSDQSVKRLRLPVPQTGWPDAVAKSSGLATIGTVALPRPPPPAMLSRLRRLQQNCC